MFENLIPLKPKILSQKLIPQAHPALLKSFGLDAHNGSSLGLLTCDMDDALFVALDEGTKDARAEVVFAKSFYAGSSHSSGPLSGEAIGIFQANDNQSVLDVIGSCRRCLQNSAWFYKTPGPIGIPFFPHIISSLGYYLSKEAQLPVSDAMAYLIAPPLESIFGIDAALKSANVKLVRHFKPPTETNFGGAYLHGPLHEVEASVRAFTDAMISLSQNPEDSF